MAGSKLSDMVGKQMMDLAQLFGQSLTFIAALDPSLAVFAFVTLSGKGMPRRGTCAHFVTGTKLTLADEL